jgi:hypothetical protein
MILFWKCNNFRGYKCLIYFISLTANPRARSFQNHGSNCVVPKARCTRIIRICRNPVCTYMFCSSLRAEVCARRLTTVFVGLRTVKITLNVIVNQFKPFTPVFHEGVIHQCRATMQLNIDSCFTIKPSEIMCPPSRAYKQQSGSSSVVVVYF